MWCVWMLACGAEPGPIKSERTEPTVSLAPEAEGQVEQVVWTDLGTRFPQPGPAMPTALAALVPGQGGAEARDVLQAAKQPGVRIVAQPIDDHLVAQTLLAGDEGLGVTLILDADGASLQQVDLALPTTEAEAALSGRWGPPTETVFDKEIRVYRWRRDGAPWVAELREVGDGKSVLKYSAP